MQKQAERNRLLAVAFLCACFYRAKPAHLQTSGLQVMHGGREKGRNYMIIKIPEKANQIIARLAQAGFEAYVVGGCVRDAVLGRTAADWDITTNARPEQVKALFPRTIDTGIQHGTVTVMSGKEGFEVTTYRIDGEYCDGRHPSEVIFTPSLLEDLKRRDFTINAMAYNETEGLVDAFGGIEDLKKGRIRCVGEPGERFTEDGLRILRAVRFSAQLGFAIEDRTREAVKEFAPGLSRISAERIQTELVKLLVSDHPETFRTLYDTGITAVILPEFDACMETPQNHLHHCCCVGEHLLLTVQAIERDKVLRLAALLHDIGKPGARLRDEQGIDHFHGHGDTGAELAGGILRRLRFDNDTICRVKHLIRVHDYRQIPLTAKGVRRAVFRIGKEYFPDYLKLRRADILAQNPAMQQEKLETLRKLEQIYGQILEEQSCLSLKELAVTGKDLIQAGMKPGPEIGETLDKMLEFVIERPECNTKAYLLSHLKI